MNQLIQLVENLKNSEIKNKIDKRILEFEKLRKHKKDRIFSELCFCILTANFNAEKCIRIQKEIGLSFSILSEKQLARKLKQYGHRFPNTRAKYIFESRTHFGNLNFLVKTDEKEIREWLAKNIKGLGMKEASHFLRNIGYKDIAIIDFHILDLLEKHNLIKKSKTLTKIKYLKIEKILKNLAEKLNLNLAELDLYLWYLETGKILK